MKKQVLLTWITSVLENLLFSGFVYGWANIQPVLVKEKYFSSHCNASVNTTSAVCNRQIELTSLVFTLSTSLGQFSCILTGYILDKLGVWTTRTILVFTIALGFILFAVSTPETSYLLLIAFPLINIGGTGTLILNHQLAGLFGALKGSYSLTSQGAANSSPIVLMVWNRLYFSGVALKTMVYFYLFFTLLLHLRTLALTPRTSVPRNLHDGYRYGYKTLSCFGYEKNKTERGSWKDVCLKESVESRYNLDDIGFKKSLKKSYFWTNVFGTSMICLSSSFFVSSLDVFLPLVLGNNENLVIEYTRTLGAFAFSSLIFAPLNGALLDYFCRKFKKSSCSSQAATFKALTISFVLSNIYMIATYTCALIPNARLQYLTLLFSVIARTSYLGCSTFLLNSCFPAKHYGKLTGVTRAFVGLAVMLQYPMIVLVTRSLNGKLTVVHVILLVVSILCLCHPTCLFKYQLNLTSLTRNRNKSVIFVKNGENVRLKDVDEKVNV